MIHYTHGNPDGWLVVGFGFGLVLFVRGLLLYRRLLLVEDTPLTPIRSVAMGLVQVRGVAKGDDAFPSPVSGTLCYAYKLEVDRWRSDSNGSHWARFKTDARGIPFYLEDATGRVLVDSQGAEFDVPRYCRREVGTSFFGPTPLDVDNRMRLSSPGDVADALPETRTDEDLVIYAQGLGASGSDRYRFTEYCILPGWEYDIVGTCVENPKPKDANDRNLITKGQEERTYLISSKPEKLLEGDLSWRSALMVWGGAALAVACAATLLSKYHLF